MDRYRIDDEQELVLKNGHWILHINGVPQESAPLYLYKFFDLNEYNVDALERSYIYMSNPKDFNDPFDCSFNLVKERQIVPQDGVPTPLPNDIENKRIACFSTIDLNPLMWAHYTGSYRGFVLKFKTNFEIIKGTGFERETLMRIIYSNNPAIITESEPFVNQYQLIIKLAHWSYENEWRIIAEKKDENADRIFYDPNHIEEVIFGFKFGINGEPALRDRVHKVVREKLSHAKKFSVGPDHASFRLKKTPLYFGGVDDEGNIVYE